jgi:RND family efflux transporter MFP subunit
MRARWILIGLVALLVVAAIAVRTFTPTTVTTATATRGPAVEVVYATGFVEVEQPVEVAARVTAPIVDVRVDEGERIARGEVLATLDPADQVAEIDRLAAATRWAEMEAARTLPLVNKGFASKAARDRVRTNLDAARAAERAARERLGNYVLRSSVDGVVLRRDAEPGDLASPSRTLFEIGDPADVKVTATIDERDIPRIRVGQSALMSTDAYPGRVFRARVREITLGGDPDQRAFRARLEPQTTEPLPVGLTLEVNIVTRERPGALLVPDRAVEDGAVWRVDNGRARRVEVETGVVGGDLVEIRRGLADGDAVVVDPPDAIKDGARVRSAKP